MRFNDFKRGQVKCKHCIGHKRRYIDIQKEVEKYGCELLTTKEEYKNTSQKLSLRCSCGNIYSTEINTFRKGQIKCSSCVKLDEPHRKLTYEQVYDYINSISECKLVSTTYKTCHEKLEFQCKCGNVFKRSLAHIRRYDYLKCNKCTKKEQALKFRFSKEDIDKRLFDIYGDKYDYIPFYTYKNTDSIIRIKHRDCGGCFDITLKELLIAERRCKVCEKQDSVGILKIINWLDKRQVSYIREHSFEDCVYKRKLPFDIYVKDLNLLIEYDGEQHFKPVNYFGGIEGLKKQQKRDHIKNQYCKEKNIHLLRIRYDQVKNIDTILENCFNKIC